VFSGCPSVCACVWYSEGILTRASSLPCCSHCDQSARCYCDSWPMWPAVEPPAVTSVSRSAVGWSVVRSCRSSISVVLHSYPPSTTLLSSPPPYPSTPPSRPILAHCLPAAAAAAAADGRRKTATKCSRFLYSLMTASIAPCCRLCQTSINEALLQLINTVHTIFINLLLHNCVFDAVGWAAGKASGL